MVSDIKAAYEAKIGRKVPKSTVYRMLERHGWRKIALRPHHPKTDPLAQESFKKLPDDSEATSQWVASARGHHPDNV